MSRFRFSLPAVLGFVALATSIAFAADKVSLDGVKCLMNPKAAAKADKSADWKEGKVYFCCGNCQAKFTKLDDAGKEKIAAKANMQLVATKQYKQGACPFSGGKLNPDTAIEVGAAKVAFCCNNCKGKAEKLSDEEKVAQLFGEKAFAKAKFAPAKSE
ncbi:MAG: hypothetical protein D6753_18070 [Planctomycetota bacterium]|nr:MAG: hypothetical protein D6753_18070 [Planctomycetota bacterium]